MVENKDDACQGNKLRNSKSDDLKQQKIMFKPKSKVVLPTLIMQKSPQAEPGEVTGCVPSLDVLGNLNHQSFPSKKVTAIRESPSFMNDLAKSTGDHRISKVVSPTESSFSRKLSSPSDSNGETRVAALMTTQHCEMPSSKKTNSLKKVEVNGTSEKQRKSMVLPTFLKDGSKSVKQKVLSPTLNQRNATSQVICVSDSDSSDSEPLAKKSGVSPSKMHKSVTIDSSDSESDLTLLSIKQNLKKKKTSVRPVVKKVNEKHLSSPKVISREGKRVQKEGSSKGFTGSPKVNPKVPTGSPKVPTGSLKVPTGSPVVKILSGMTPPTKVLQRTMLNFSKVQHGNPSGAALLCKVPKIPALIPVVPKSIVISIDMKPDEWNKLTKEQQMKIIEEKKSMAKRQTSLVLQSSSLVQAGATGGVQNYLNKQQQSQVAPATWAQSFERRDDLEVPDLKPLPPAKAIPIPEGFPSQHFGDLIMIATFLQTFNKFLMIEDILKISAAELMEALAGGEKLALKVAKILLLFMKILLGNETFTMKDLKIELADLPLTEYTASYLVHLYLESQLLKVKKKFSSDERVDKGRVVNSADSIGEETVQESMKRISAHLEGNEFYTLACEDQMKVLVYLTNRILDSDSLSNYFEDLASEKSEVLRQFYAEKRQRAEEQARKSGNLPAKPLAIDRLSKPVDVGAATDNAAVAGADKVESKDAAEGGVKTADKSNDDKKDSVDEAPSTKASVPPPMTQRQLDAIKEQQMKAMKDKKDKELRDELEWKQREEQIEKKLSEMTLQIKMSQRLEPLGMDRYHRLYWVFGEGVPGLYVEDGWRYDRPERDSWCYYDSMDDVDKLIAALSTRGLREEKLRLSLRASYKSLAANVLPLKRSDDIASKAKLAVPSEESSSAPDKLEAKLGTKESCSGLSKGAADDMEKGSGKPAEGIPVEEDVGNGQKKTDAENVAENAVEQGEKRGAEPPVSPVESTAVVPGLPAVHGLELASLQAIKEDMVESANRLVFGALGDLPEISLWTEALQAVHTKEGMVQYVLQLQECIYPKFLHGALDASDSSSGMRESWQAAVSKAKTVSALHTLYGILENSIKWERSAENTRCRVCRRIESKLTDVVDVLVLCDACNMGYHAYCLRPPLIDIPEGEWKCPSCLPIPPRSSRRNPKQADGNEEEVDKKPDKDKKKAALVNKNESELEDGDDDEDGDQASCAGSWHEEQCHVCDTGGELILCDTCPFSYHFECHNPPLRRAPRGHWACQECRNPKPKTRQHTLAPKKIASKSKTGSKSRHVDSEESADDDAVSCDDGEEIVQPASCTRKVKSSRDKKRKRARKVLSSDTESSERESVCVDNAKKKKVTGSFRVTKSSTDQQVKSGAVLRDSDDGSRGPLRMSIRLTRGIDSVESVVSRCGESDHQSMESDDGNGVALPNIDECDKSSCTDTEDGSDGSQPLDRLRRDVPILEVSLSKSGQKGGGGESVSPTLGNRRPRYAKDTLKAARAEEDSLGPLDGEDSSTCRKSKAAAKRKLTNMLAESSMQKIFPTSDRSDSHRNSRNAKRSRRGNSDEFVACENILIGLQRHDDAQLFLRISDLNHSSKEADGVLDDIGKKLDSLAYEDALQFVDDVKGAFERCRDCCKDDVQAEETLKRLEATFQRLIEEHLPGLSGTLK